MARFSQLKICAALLGLGLLIAFSSVRAETLQVRADEWCPFNCEPSSNAPGYVIEIAQEVFRPHDIVIDYKLMPWSRALAQVERGDINAVVGVGHAEAPNLVYPEEAVGAPNAGFAVRRGEAFAFNGIASFYGRRVAAVQDYSYDNGGPIDTYLSETVALGDGSVTLLSGDEVTKRLMRLLLTGRVDVILEFSPVARYNLLQIDGGDTIDLIDLPPTERDEIYVAFSPKRSDARHHAKLFAEGLREMRRSGRLSVILARYGLSDWRTKTVPDTKQRGSASALRPNAG